MSALFRRPGTLCQCQRAFSTSSLRAVSLQWAKNEPEALADVLPPYPYGPTQWYKQSRHGLYGGQRIQFGNNVTGKHDTKTRRKWRVNVFTRKLFSKALNRLVQIRVSARVLRTIDKLGGLDEYLLGEKQARIKELGESGWWLRWAIMQTPSIKKRFAQERKRLGIPEFSESVELITEESVNESEEGTSEEEMDAVPMDDTFRIEQTADQPRIKFRVGPGQHIMLTPNGWRRTRPDPSHAINLRKRGITRKKLPNFVEQRTNAFVAELEARKVKDTAVRNTLIKRARAVIEAELQTEVEKLSEEVESKLQIRDKERKARKRQKRTRKLAAYKGADETA